MQDLPFSWTFSELTLLCTVRLDLLPSDSNPLLTTVLINLLGKWWLNVALVSLKPLSYLLPKHRNCIIHCQAKKQSDKRKDYFLSFELSYNYLSPKTSEQTMYSILKLIYECVLCECLYSAHIYIIYTYI